MRFIFCLRTPYTYPENDSSKTSCRHQDDQLHPISVGVLNCLIDSCVVPLMCALQVDQAG